LPHRTDLKNNTRGVHRSFCLGTVFWSHSKQDPPKGRTTEGEKTILHMFVFQRKKYKTTTSRHGKKKLIKTIFCTTALVLWPKEM